MPLPYIIGAAVAYGAKKVYDHITKDDVPSSNYSPNVPSWNKKTIVIGPKGSGKTTLANLMADQKINDIQPTTERTTVGSYISDYPGYEHCVDTDWADAIQKTRCCLYVFDLKSYDDNIIYENHNYQKLVLWHIDLIHDWIKQKDDSNGTFGSDFSSFLRSQFIVIGTHSDTLEKEAPNRILNNIKSELKKRNKEISIRHYNLLEIESKKLIETIEKD
ncbi:GTPase domain-containing protein [Sulfuricurvum sp.]|uniref:GTPase domain-containing protein n=1 Tax=Sulfuricurvum sp. TaxID=2025608 RepID=UPI002D346F69|nr:GTPase domain-containing protein [Sulfuricurvum sp.]HZF71241.1 GTPase domain-containing protein [Sulfuricurvum sp.]